MPGPAERTTLNDLQGRYWLLTIPVGDWSPPETLDPSLCYIKGQQEIGETNQYHHWQLLVISKKLRGPRLKRLFSPSTNVELSRSAAAEAYVWKDETAVAGTRFEIGEKPFKRNSKTDWEQVKAKAKAGLIDEIEGQVYVQHYRTLKQIAMDNMAKPDDLTSTCGIWIYGPPGVGKSHFARQHYPDIYNKMQNKWWCGYQGEKSILIDDFDSKQLGHHLKIWADKYSFIAETKGYAITIRPDRIIVTSNYTPDQIFSDDPVLAEAIKRRFYLINMPMWFY